MYSNSPPGFNIIFSRVGCLYPYPTVNKRRKSKYSSIRIQGNLLLLVQNSFLDFIIKIIQRWEHCFSTHNSVYWHLIIQITLPGTTYETLLSGLKYLMGAAFVSYPNASSRRKKSILAFKDIYSSYTFSWWSL